MTAENRTYITHGLRWGASCGISLIIFMVLSNYAAAGNSGLQTTGIIQYIILSFSIYLCQRSFITRKLSDNPNFTIFFLIGLICGVSSSLFVDLYMSVYIKIINPESVEQTIEESQKILKESKLYSEASLNQAQEITKKIFSVSVIIINTIIYAVLSAIFSAFSAFMLNFNNKKTR